MDTTTHCGTPSPTSTPKGHTPPPPAPGTPENLGSPVNVVNPQDTLRIRLDIAYDGTDFHGWAHQPGLRTVCGEITSALSLICQRDIPVTVAGRTDAGVHATGQVAHCDIPLTLLEHRSCAGDPQRLARRIQSLLPADIALRRVTGVSEAFDARFSALRRHYVYRIDANGRGGNPLRSRDTALWSRPLDCDRMNEASQALLGVHDFAAFSKYREGATTIRHLQRFSWDVHQEECGPVLHAYVTADAFCWSMVRGLVGCIAQVGQGKKPVSWPGELLSLTHRCSDIRPAPARGLCLYQVDYPEDSELLRRQKVTRMRRDAGECDERKDVPGMTIPVEHS